MTHILTRALGGPRLTQAALAGDTPPGWYAPVPRDAGAWSTRVAQVAAEFSDGTWLERLAPAFDASGAAAARLQRAAAQRGAVVTTGQQPGLFGGPIYTWAKAFTALALADELEARSGVPIAPVFWAATDDTDFVEASQTAVAHAGEVRDIVMEPAAPPGRSMAAMPLGDVSRQLDQLAEAAGSAVDPWPLDAVRRAYTADATVGGAYVLLLRELLEPLGITVLDAAHPALRTAAQPLLHTALWQARDVSHALAERNAAVERAGYKLQVQDVPGLSLVFRTDGASRKRVTVKEGARIAAEVTDGVLGANVLLRPVIERALLPTCAYIGGPAEIAYFAQSTAVAQTLGLPEPLIVPRWSGVVVEPHVQDTLIALHVDADAFADPHAIEGRVAREELNPTVSDALAALRTAVATQSAILATAARSAGVTPRVPAGFDARMRQQIDRLERRYAAAVKRSTNVRMRAVATARAALYPHGKPQERVLNFIPFLARYGVVVRDAMIMSARHHARQLVSGG